MKRAFYNGILFLTIIILQSCDPTYPVLINNQTDSEIIIQGKKTLDFWNENLDIKNLKYKNDVKWIEFTISPKETAKCGMTIGGLNDDLPFSELIIIKPTDTIKAENEYQIMELFDKTFFGNLKTPYVLTVE